ncbi:MAG: PhoH family protein [Alphaproteobacteria bacterium]|nr:PhoH family protein [Alphaproteobacteria bacterium]
MRYNGAISVDKRRRINFLTSSHILEFENKDLVPLLFGEHNAHLSHLEHKLNISIADRGHKLSLSGNDSAVKKAETILKDLMVRLEKKQDVSVAEIDAALRFFDNDHGDNAKQNGKNMSGSDIVIKTKKKTISPRSPNQAEYLKMIEKNSMVFGVGPAGTGKTYLAVAKAVEMFLDNKVERLIFTRPAVEAGERLGFLPGDMKDKVDPYLRPIYDALHDMLPWDVIVKKMEAGEIEVAPLAFMRGRTLSNAFVILDEAQNTTRTQMKMFLTRMGESSRMVITGDLTQTDLPRDVKSGLRDAHDILEGVEGIKFLHFAKEDVIRHPLVSKIVQAYDEQN